jgi:hypothetical protein
MFWSQKPWVDLSHAVVNHSWSDVYPSILEPWASENSEERNWIHEFDHRTASDWNAATPEDLCRLYAIFRVASILLLRFQLGRADRTDYPGPHISEEGFKLFFEAMGFRVPQAREFHPFFHEIIGVEQESDVEASPVILDQRWPPLMLGCMMFCRAGVIVAAGAKHIVKAIAEQSTLYWTYQRKDRRCNDLSHGWGHNSQWRTDLRRDYQSPNGFHYNIDADEALNAATNFDEDISVDAMIELVRNRCMIRTSVDDSDLFPYRYSYVEIS